MYRSFTATIKGLDGRPIMQDSIEGDGELRKVVRIPLRLGDACVAALTSDLQSERGVDGAEKFKRYLLAERIHIGMAGNAAIEVDAEEISLLKRLVSLMYVPMVVGPAYRALETDATPPPSAQH